MNTPTLADQAAREAAATLAWDRANPKPVIAPIKHTPLPWKAEMGSLIYGPNDTANALGSMFHHRVGQKEADANTALIVQAVNSHAELVAALKEVTESLYLAMTWYVPEPDGNSLLNRNRKRFTKAGARARAALAKLEARA